MIHDVGLVLLGVVVTLGAQGFLFCVRKLLGLRTAAEKAEALRDEAERRAREAEDKQRLAELEAARLGAPAPASAPVKRISARPLN